MPRLKTAEGHELEQESPRERLVRYINELADSRGYYAVTLLATAAPQALLTYLNINDEWYGYEYLAYETHIDHFNIDLVNALMLLQVALTSCYTLDQLRNANHNTMLRYIERAFAILTTAVYWTLINETGFSWNNFYLHGLNLAIEWSGQVLRGDTAVPNFNSGLVLNSLKFLTPLLLLGLYVAAEALLTVYAGLTDKDGNPIYAKQPWLTDPEKAGMWAGIGAAGMVGVNLMQLLLDYVSNKILNYCFSNDASNDSTRDYVVMASDVESGSQHDDPTCSERWAASYKALTASAAACFRRICPTPSQEQDQQADKSLSSAPR